MAFSFLPRQGLIGLDIGSGAIKLVQLKKSGKGYKLEKFGIKELDPEWIVEGSISNPGKVVSEIKALLEEQKVHVKNVALSVSGHSVIVKRIQLPLMTEDELAESIRWESEQHIPFDIKDVNMDYHVLGKIENQEGPAQMDVALVAVKKDKLQEYTGLATDAGLTPVVVDVDAFTLGNMYEANYEIKEGEIIALINMGASVMNINILKGGNFAFTRDISIGGNRYTETIQRELNVDLHTAEGAKRTGQIENVDPEALLAIIHSLNVEVANEIVRSFDYYKTTAMDKNIDRIFMGGGASKLPDLISQISEKSGLPVEAVNPFKNVQVQGKSFDPDFIKEIAPLAAVGVGLAMRSAKED